MNQILFNELVYCRLPYINFKKPILKCSRMLTPSNLYLLKIVLTHPSSQHFYPYDTSPLTPDIIIMSNPFISLNN